MPHMFRIHSESMIAQKHPPLEEDVDGDRPIAEPIRLESIVTHDRGV
jgi:hypothetical protein